MLTHCLVHESNMKQLIKSFSFILAVVLTSQNASAKVLSSQVVREQTITQSLSAKSEKLNPLLALEDLRDSKSQYDTTFSADFLYTKDESERANTVFGTESTTINYDIGFDQLLPTGTALQFDFLNTKESNNSPFIASPTLFDSRFSLGISQPILNNYFGYQNRKLVSATKKAYQAQQKASTSKLQKIILDNLTLYWSWVLQRTVAQVDAQALTAARKLYKTNKEKQDIGLIEKMDLYAFAANRDLIHNNRLSSENQLDRVTAQLASALSLRSDDLEYRFEKLQKVSFAKESDLVEKALKNNPEFLALKDSLKAQNITVSLQKNSKLPSIDLVGSLTLNGVDPSYSTAFSDIQNNNTVLVGGVNVSFPIQNRASRAAFKKAKVKKQQLLYSVKNFEQQLIENVKATLKNYKHSLKRVYVTSQAVKHQKLKWQGEIKRYDQGRSDPDLVIRYQNDYLDTKKLNAQARYDFEVAKLQLQYLLGEI